MDESVTEEDIEAWLEEMGADSSVRKKQKKMAPEQIKAAIINLVPETGTIPKYEVVAAATAKRISRDDVRDYIKILLREKRLFAHNVREGKSRPEVHLSRQDEPCQEGATLQAVEHEETAV